MVASETDNKSGSQAKERWDSVKFFEKFSEISSKVQNQSIKSKGAHHPEI